MKITSWNWPGTVFFAEVLHWYELDRGKRLLRGLDSIMTTLIEYQVEERRLCLDGEDLAGEYLMVEAFNTPMLGPRPRLAQEADTSDGLFDVILIEEDTRSEWALARGLPMSAGSDAHTLAEIGSAWVEVHQAPASTPAELLAVLSGGKPAGLWTHPVKAYVYKLWDRTWRRVVAR